MRLAALRAGARLAAVLRTVRLAVFFAAVFLAGARFVARFAAVFLAGDFRTVRLAVFFAAVLRAAVFLAGDFRTVRLAVFFAAVFLAGARFVVRFAAVFLAAVFLAGARFVVRFAAVFLAAVFLAGAFRTAFLPAAFFTGMDTPSLGFNADLNVEPVANRTPFDAGIGTTAPVRGFRPTRGARAVGVNVPKPTTVTLRPDRTSAMMVANSASTTSSVVRRADCADLLTTRTS